MSFDDVLHLRVELHVRDGTVDGDLRESEGGPVTFSGWIALVAVIDEAVRRAGRAPGAPADRRLSPAKDSR